MEQVGRAGPIDSEMLRRAANACRSAQRQMVGDKDWFSWVAAWLDQQARQQEASRPGPRALGDRADPTAS